MGKYVYVSKKGQGKTANNLLQILTDWCEQAAKIAADEISKEEYDRRRYKYPEFDTTQILAKVPSQELSDALVDAFKDKLNNM